jgi:hypothetical protein
MIRRWGYNVILIIQVAHSTFLYSSSRAPALKTYSPTKSAEFVNVRRAYRRADEEDQRRRYLLMSRGTSLETVELNQASDPSL